MYLNRQNKFIIGFVSVVVALLVFFLIFTNCFTAWDAHCWFGHAFDDDGICTRCGAEKTYTAATVKLSYAIGGIDEAGDNEDGKTSIRSIGYFELKDNMSFELVKDAEITYKLYFYNSKKALIDVSDSQNAAYKGEIPEKAVYYRVVIQPVAEDGEEVEEISISQINGIAKQLEIHYYK